MLVRSSMAALALAGCGGGAVLHGGDWLVRARDEPAISASELRAHFVAPVAYRGLAFEDATCAHRFGEPATLDETQLDAFVACLAPLGFRAIADRAAHADGERLVEYGPGLEVAVAVGADHRVTAIGFAGADPAAPLVAMLGDAALGNLRASGGDDAPVATWVRLCLDEHGAIAHADPVDPATPDAIRAAAAAVIALWKFKPFVFGGRPRAACSLVHLDAAQGVDRLPI